MEIIQSFALFDEGTFYASDTLKGQEKYLHFYTFLFSYLNLKKYYNFVTMYCNKSAYDTFIKFIPYDKIVLKENKYISKFWSAYKLDVISEVKTPFIHVDSDVFIFDDLFKPFIDQKYDLMVQYKFDFNCEKWNYNDICSIKNFDNMSFTCGVLGISNVDIINKYLKNTTNVYNNILSGLIDGNNAELGFLLEEFTLYLTALQYNLNWYEILPYDEIKKTSLNETCLNHKYTHMWFQSKYQEKNINIIKNKILTMYPEYYYLVENYEEYLYNNNITKTYYS